MRVLLTGGGTAGHINPALAIAETVLQNEPGSEIAFVGIKGGKEEDLVPRAGYPLRFVQSQGIRRSLSLSNIKALWLALTSPYSRQTTEILDDFKPDVVIGTGGYACWPIMAAAARRGIPTALHESNARPGLAVRQLKRRVDRIWVNFEKTKELLSCGDRVVRVGNPLRGDFGRLSREEARRRLRIDEDSFLVLSFGGSLGAERINGAMLSVMDSLSSEKIVFLHAAGLRNAEAMRRAFHERGLDQKENCRLSDYIYDMPVAMAAADVVICRAGAMTLSELAGMKKPSILIPSPNVADNHQFYNAKALADGGAAILVEEEELESGALEIALRRLLGDRNRLRLMGECAATFHEMDSNRLIWDEILKLTKK